uniref:Cathepsin E-like n=1 Tax=Echeneis naucrates TaxID=173247 RepID=A0A665TMN1_ECHNA
VVSTGVHAILSQHLRFKSHILDPPRVPLRRVRSIRSQLRAEGLLEEFMKHHRPDAFNRRYAQCFPPGTPSLRLGRSSEKIYNFMDVRRPAQTLSWCVCFPASHRHFRAFESTSFHHDGRMFGIHYGSGHLLGVMARETLKIGHLTTLNQEFGESVYEPGAAFVFARFDGVLGMGYPSLAEILGNPVFDNMMAQKIVDEPVFSFYLSRNSGSSPEGELLLGGADETKYSGPITWIPVTVKGYWQIKVGQGIGSFCPRGCQAIVDTGTSLIAGPTSDIINLQQLIGATPTNIGEYLIDCVRLPSLPHVTFVLAGAEFTLTAEHYVRKEMLGDRMLCFSGFQALDIISSQGPLWILGDVFQTRTTVSSTEDRTGSVLLLLNTSASNNPSISDSCMINK